MSHTNGGILAEQIKNLDILPQQPKRERAASGVKTVQQVGTKFVLREVLTPDGAKREAEFAGLIDKLSEWVGTCVETLILAWDGAKEVEEESESYDIHLKHADACLKALAELLGGEGIKEANLTSDEQALCSRLVSMYYAAAVWSAGDVPVNEVARALWFVAKSGAAEITHNEPKGVENVRVALNTWITFPFVTASGPETPDSRAMKKSKLLSFIGVAVRLAKTDAEGFWRSRESVMKESTIASTPGSIRAFLEKPYAGNIALRVQPQYRKETNLYRSGGMVSVKVRGDDESGYFLSVADVFDDHLLPSLRDAVDMSKGSGFLLEKQSLSAYLRGTAPRTSGCEYLSSVEIPMNVFCIENLNSWKVSLTKRCGDDEFKAVLAIVKTVRPAFLSALRRETTPQKQKENAERRKSTQAARNADVGKPERPASGGAVEDLKAALVRASVKNRLPIKEMPAFYSPEMPSGVTLASIPALVSLEGDELLEDVSCVLLRRKRAQREEVYAFPSCSAELFSGERRELILAKLAAYAKCLHDSREMANEPSELPTETAAKEEKEALPQTLSETEHSEKDSSRDEVKWASPQARALAEERSIDVSELAVFAQGKKVTKADVQKFLETKK